MANSRMLFPNRGDLGSFDAVGSWEATLPLANLQDTTLSKVARSTNAAVASTKYGQDLAADYLLRGFALVKHNLSLDGQVRLRGHLGETFTRTGTATYSDVTTVGATSDRILRTAADGVARSWNYDASGNRSRLLEGARENGWTFSENLANGAWTKQRVSAPVTPTVVGPDGETTTTSRITEDGTANTTHYIRRNTPTLANDTDQSLVFYAKAGERTWAAVVTKNKAGIESISWVNIVTGATGTVDASHSTTVTAAGNGWFRIEVVWDSASGGTTPFAQVHLADADNNLLYNGDGASGLFVLGLQFEADAPFASSYIKTVASTVTRNVEALVFDYTPVPQALTIYVKFEERGTINGTQTIVQIGKSDNSAPYISMASNGSGKYRAKHSGIVDSIMGVAPSVGDIVELLFTVTSTGVVQIAQSIKGGALVTATASGANALTAAWSDTKIWVNSIGSSQVGFNAFHSVKVASGSKTLAEMQALRPEDDDVLFFDEPYDSQWVKAYGVIYPATSTLWGENVGGLALSAENYAAGARSDYIDIFSEMQKFRHLLVDIDDTGNADSYVEIGRQWLANSYQPSINFIGGAMLGWTDDQSTSTVTDGGATFFDQKNTRRKFDCTFENVDADEALVQMLEMMRRWGISSQFFFIYDPADTIHMQRRAFLATLEELSRLRIPYSDWHTQPFSIVEVL